MLRSKGMREFGALVGRRCDFWFLATGFDSLGAAGVHGWLGIVSFDQASCLVATDVTSATASRVERLCKPYGHHPPLDQNSGLLH